MESAEEITPVPVAPLSRTRRLLGGTLLVAMWAAIGVCAVSLVKPRVLVERAAGAVVIRASPEVFARQVAALVVAVICAVAARVVVGRRLWGITGLVLVAVLPVPVWHQHAARVVVTPDTLTAPGETGLLPGRPVTLRFDQIAFISLVDRDSAGSKFQHCYMKDGREVSLELGPLITEAGPVIDDYARNRAVKVSWR